MYIHYIYIYIHYVSMYVYAGELLSLRTPPTSSPFDRTQRYICIYVYAYVYM